jgi:predicted ATPase
MIELLAIANYRSLRQVVVPMGRLTVVTGANGSGKSSLYRALRLLANTSQGGVVASLAREGGLQSTLWAGPEEISRAMRKGTAAVHGGPRRDVVNLRLGFASDTLSYAIDLGLPTSNSPSFGLDPAIKRECIWAGPKFRTAALLADRRGPAVRVRNRDGDWDLLRQDVATFDSMLMQVADANRAPEILTLRERMRMWRFYDHFRVDADSPARQPQLGTQTPVLSHDGRDLAAALQTIREIGDARALDAAVDDAFPGSRVEVSSVDYRFDIEMYQHGLLRPLKSAELSDGTLRFLSWIAALLTPRPPELMVLDEPEMSLHPDLLPAFARLIIHAAKDTQVWVVTHSSRLAAALAESGDCCSIVLEKELGETRIVGQSMMNKPTWEWPPR